MIKKWLKERKQFIIAAVVFSLFGTGVTFALPYLPTDAELDPTCAPGDTDCYVDILTPWDSIGDPLTNGSISFGETEQIMRWANFTNALDGITFYFDNNGGTANTDSGMVLANEFSTNTSGDLNTENILLIQQLDSTTFGTTVVDNFLKIDVAANSGGIDGIEITNSAGNLTNGINLVDTAGGTFTTGIVFSGTFTNAIDTGTTTLSLAELDVLDAGIELGDLTVQGTADDEFCLTSETGGGALLAWQACGSSSLTVGSSAIGSGTEGGILFEGAGNVLQEDAANFFWDDSNNRLGIGTNTPSQALQVYTAAADSYISMVRGDTAYHAAFTISNSGAYSDTNRLWSVGKQAGDENLTFWNWDGAAVVRPLTLLKTGNVGIGDTTPAALFTVGSGDRFQLDANGNFLTTSNATTGNAGLITANSLTTGDGLEISSSSLTSGSLLKLDSTGTAADGQAALVINLSGANATTNKNSFAGWIENTHTNSGNNYGLYVSVTGGQSNVAASFNNGNVGIGTMAPTTLLDVTGASSNQALLYLNSTSGNNLVKINSPSADEAGILIQDNGATSWEIIRESSGTDLAIYALVGKTLAITQTGTVTLGESNTTGSQLVLDTKTSAGDPTGINGGMYYNSNTNKFRCYENTAWANCITPAGASVFSALTAATGTNTIDNLDFAQAWDWSTADTENPLTMNANALTSGKLLTLASSSTAFTGNIANFTLSGSNAANTGAVVQIDNTGTLSTNTGLLINHYATGTNNLAFRINDVSGDTSPFVIDGAGLVGIGTAAPTHSLTLDSTNTGITSYNTSDQTTNYERVRQFWSSNTFYINSEKGGTGTDRSIIINGVTFQSGGFTGFVTADWLTVTNIVSPASGLNPLVLTGTPVRLTNFTSAISSGSIITTDINPDINQSGTAGYTGLRISAYEQTVGSGSKYLMDLGTNTAAAGAGTHTSLFNVSNTGRVGIGVASVTTSKLEVLGDIGASFGADTTRIIGIGLDGSFSSGDTGVFRIADPFNQIETTFNGPMIGRGYNGWQFFNDAGETARFGTGPASLDSYFTGKLGVGTTAPGVRLSVSDNSAALQSLSAMAGTVMVVGGANDTRSRLVIDSYGTNTSGTASILTFRTARGTSASPTANQADDILGNISVQGYGATSYQANSKAALLIYASQNWTDSAQGTYLTLNTVPDGTAGVASERMRIGQDGFVGINDTTPDGLLDLDSSATTGVNLGITNTGAYTGTGLFSVVANSATTGTVGLMTANGLSSGTLLSLTSSSTAAASDSQKILNVSTSGANGTSGQTTYGGYFSNTHTGTSSLNIAIYAVASGGTQNAAIGVEGDLFAYDNFTLKSEVGGGTNGYININSDTTSIGTNATNWLSGGTNVDTVISTVTNAYNIVIDPKTTGKVGVNDTTPDYLFDIDADVADFASAIFNDGNATTRSGLLIQGGLDDHTAAGPSTLIEFRDGDGGTVGSITFGSSATAYNTTSDQRLKQNITDSTLTIGDLMNVKIHDYTWVSDPSNNLAHGVLAQELYQVYPLAVTKPVDESTGTWMVDYSKLTPLVIKSIQDLKINSDLNFELLSSLDTSIANSFGNKVKNILADAQNGVIELYAKNINSDRVKTKELCVGDVCVNEAQFLQMVQSAGISNNPQNNPAPEPTPTPDPAPENEPTPIPDEPTPDPEPTPEPTPEIPIENNP